MINSWFSCYISFSLTFILQVNDNEAFVGFRLKSTGICHFTILQSARICNLVLIDPVDHIQSLSFAAFRLPSIVTLSKQRAFDRSEIRLFSDFWRSLSQETSIAYQ